MSDPGRTREGARIGLKEGGVSFFFLMSLLVFAGAVYELGIGRGGAIGVFVLVFVGWIISLCLHEWGHAVVAWYGGDRSVAERGYLTLNPIRYANPLFSIILPLAFLAMGGIGFPGGAVYVNRSALKSSAWSSAVSAAGPAMNVLCLVLLALVLRFAPLSDPLAGGLAFLAFLQTTAIILNLLPVPGLDGFGIIESLFPANERAAIASIGGFVSIAFLVVLYSAPSLFTPLWNAALTICGFLGVREGDIANGDDLFRFWTSGPG
ncbi:MAG TPA: site-2 protease family protein [Caulobacterales bacterium]|nr:site-2 protease family protein [Caulobacterales bacterium]